MGAFSASELVFISIFGGEIYNATVIGLLLIITGMVFSMAFQVFKRDPDVTGKEATGIISWAFVLLFAFVVTSVFVPQIQFVTASVVTYQAFFAKVTFSLSSPGAITGAFIFIAILIPNAEEQFFRGFWGNLFLYLFRKHPELALIPAGAVFALFHLGNYGLNLYTLGILFLDGMLMVFVGAFITGSITASIIAHSLNNGLNLVVGAGIVAGLLPHVLLPIAGFAVPLALLGFGMLRVYKRRGLIGMWRLS